MSEGLIIVVLALACMVVGAYVLFETAMKILMKILIWPWNKFWGWVEESEEWEHERQDIKDRNRCR